MRTARWHRPCAVPGEIRAKATRITAARTQHLGFFVTSGDQVPVSRRNLPHSEPIPRFTLPLSAGTTAPCLSPPTSKENFRGENPDRNCCNVRAGDRGFRGRPSAPAARARLFRGSSRRQDAGRQIAGRQVSGRGPLLILTCEKCLSRFVREQSCATSFVIARSESDEAIQNLSAA